MSHDAEPATVRAQVRVRADGRDYVLAPGDIIGRMPSAAIVIEDPRISEAHALVTLRGAGLKLLALRGRLSVDGRPATSATLEPDARVLLSGFFPLTVLAVELPTRVAAVVLETGGGALAPQIVAGVMALADGAPPEFVPRFDPDAPAVIWVGAGGVHLRTSDGDRVLVAGDAASIALPSGAVTLRVVDVPLDSATSDTTLDQGSFDVALTLVVHYDTVHVRPSHGTPIVFDGLAARLISEVAALRTPVAWLSLAKLIWADEDDEHVLRYRWDQATSRIRKKLRAARVRADLLRSTGGGLVELYLGPDDRIEDLS